MPPYLAMPSLGALNWTLALVGIIGVIIGIWRSEFISLWAQVPGALVGRGEKKDRSGRVTREAEPGLLSRMGTVEGAVTTLVETSKETAQIRIETGQLRNDLAAVSHRVEGLEQTVAAIIADKWDAGSKAVLKAVEKRNEGVIDVEEES